jgi:phosphoribosylanthranilate isomerase
MKVFTQIYEIVTPEEAERIVALGVDRVGTVLVSVRDMLDQAVRDTVARTRELGAVASCIPLFSGEEEVLRAADFHRPHILHLCDALCGADGRILPLAPFLSLQEAVRREFPGLLLTRTIPVALPGKGHLVDSLALAREFAPVSDMFLTDTWLGAEDPVAGYVGITGRTCDWDVAAGLVKAGLCPVILAGGLGPENVGAGIRTVRPAGVDSCTLTNGKDKEGRPVRFRKDLGLVARFVGEARKAADT